MNMDHSIWKNAGGKDDEALGIIEKLKRITHNGNASEAYLLAAKTLGHKKLEQKFQGIKKLRDIDGYLDSNLSKYQYATYQELMEFAKSVLSDDVFHQFYKCF